MSSSAGKMFHPINHASIDIYEGFSWPCLFFGPLWYAAKGLWLWAVAELFIVCFTCGCAWIIFPFFANKMHRKHLESQGYLSDSQVMNTQNARQQYTTFTQPLAGINVPVQSVAVPNNVPLQNIAQTPTQHQSQASLEQFIRDVMSKHKGFQKSFANDTLPQEKKQKLMKKFQPINLNAEKLLFVGIYGMGNMMMYGIIITEQNMYWRLSKGFLGLTKSGSIPLRAINSLSAEHTMVHSCYGGGNPGPEFKLNGEVIGWIQSLGCISEEDQNLIIDLINQINNSGILLRMR